MYLPHVWRKPKEATMPAVRYGVAPIMLWVACMWKPLDLMTVLHGCITAYNSAEI